MDRRELITILKEPAYKVMRELKIPASIIMAISITILEQDELATIAEDLVLGNNPMAIEPLYSYDGETIFNEINKKEYRVYGKLEEGLANYITSNNEIFEGMKGILQYTYALRKNETFTTEEKDYLCNIIEEFSLYDLDKKASDIFFSTKPMVEISTLDYLDKATELKQSMGLVEKDNNTSIKKATIPIKPIIKKLNDNLESKTISHGTKIFVLNANLYETAVSNVPKRCITGDFYIRGGACENNRYAITRSHSSNSTYPVMGYVDIKQIMVTNKIHKKG